MSNTIDVLIVGAGPTGLLLGSILAGSGCSVRIIDKLQTPLRISKASGIMPRSLEVFQMLGIAERFVDAGNKIEDLSLYGPKGRLLRMSFEQLDTPFQFLLGLEQYRTEEILSDRVRELGVAVERGRELIAFEQDDNGVWATVGGDSESTETVECRFIVGCDGAHSTVRHTLGLPFEGSQDHDHYIVGYLTIDWAIPTTEMFELSSAKGTIFGIPLPEGRWAVAGEYDPQQWRHAEDETPDMEEVQALFVERSPFPARVSDPRWISYFRVNH
ncbi:MAG TPA: FAD-dependent monooxygenase, partial [Spirochaetia bacterium]|nr:FAD-dependent monooxygenase [Spirochaetia bacterium]